MLYPKECSASTWGKCIFCCCWLESSRDVCQVWLTCSVVQAVLSFKPGCELAVELSVPSILSVLFHAFWIFVVSSIYTCYVSLMD